MPHFNLIVINNTAVTIDQAAILFGPDKISVGPIAPGERATSYFNRHHHSPGPLEMRITVNGKTVQRIDQTYCDDGRLKSRALEVRIEPRELPK